MKRTPLKRKRGIIKGKATKRSTKGAAEYEAFGKLWLGKPCWHCGKRLATERHHIVKRRGKAYDDRRNLFAACCLCHSRIEGNTIVIDKERLLPIPLETALRIKQRRDGLDLPFLRELSGRRDFGEGIE